METNESPGEKKFFYDFIEERNIEYQQGANSEIIKNQETTTEKTKTVNEKKLRGNETQK